MHLRLAVAVTGSLALFASSARSEPIAGDESLLAPDEKKTNGTHVGQPESMHWKPGKGLVVTSKDGDFTVMTRLRLQMLGQVENESGAPAEMGVVLRRARLQFLGNTFGKHNRFKAEFAFSPFDVRIKEIDGNKTLRETPLLSWYLEFDKNPNATVRMGQYKIPFSRQRVISSGNQQMVDRSIANGEFNLDRDIGLDVRSKDFLGLGLFRYYLGIYNGEGRSVSALGNSNLMYLGRVEVLPLGMFKDYSEGDFQRLSKPGVSIGLGYSYAPEASGTKVNRSGTPDDLGVTDFHSVTADVTFKYQGLSLSSELFWRDGTRKTAQGEPAELGADLARQGVGWFAQAGYLLPRRLVELTGRYGEVRPKGDSALSLRHEGGLGASYYPGRHPFKVQVDAFQLWGDEALSDGETRVRVQGQVSF